MKGFHLLSESVEQDCRRLNPEPREPIQHQGNICGTEALHMPSSAFYQLLHQLRRLQLCI